MIRQIITTVVITISYALLCSGYNFLSGMIFLLYLIYLLIGSFSFYKLLKAGNKEVIAIAKVLVLQQSKQYMISDTAFLCLILGYYSYMFMPLVFLPGIALYFVYDYLSITSKEIKE